MILQKSNNILTLSNKRLSVQVSLTGLSFLISHTETKELLFLTQEKFENSRTPEELLLAIDGTFSEYNELQTKFDEITLVYATESYCLVPTPLFDESKASDYLKFNSIILENDFIAHDTIENYDIKVVYVPFVNINNYMFDRFGSFQYYQSTTLLIKWILDTEKHGNGYKAFIHILDTTFDLIILNNGNLELCNTYSFSTPEDFIYYILFGFEQLKLNPDKIETILCGAISENDDNFRIAYRYIRNISIKKNEAIEDNRIKVGTSISNFVLINNL